MSFRVLAMEMSQMKRMSNLQTGLALVLLLWVATPLLAQPVNGYYFQLTAR